MDLGWRDGPVVKWGLAGLGPRGTGGLGSRTGRSFVFSILLSFLFSFIFFCIYFIHKRILLNVGPVA